MKYDQYKFDSKDTEILARELAIYKTVDAWLEARKKAFQERWEKESLEQYERSRTGLRNDDPPEGAST